MKNTTYPKQWTLKSETTSTPTPRPPMPGKRPTLATKAIDAIIAGVAAGLAISAYLYF